MSPPVRVVIADDHPMFRYGLRAVLDAAEEVTVVGEATDGQQLLSVVDQTRPDVVLTATWPCPAWTAPPPPGGCWTAILGSGCWP